MAERKDKYLWENCDWFEKDWINIGPIKDEPDSFHIKSKTTSKAYVMKIEIIQSQSEVKDKLAELENLANIKHDNIISVAEFHWDCLIMSYSMVAIISEQGITNLEKDNRSCSENDVIDIATQIALAIEHLHLKELSCFQIHPSLIAKTGTKYLLIIKKKAKNQFERALNANLRNFAQGSNDPKTIENQKKNIDIQQFGLLIIILLIRATGVKDPIVFPEIDDPKYRFEVLKNYALFQKKEIKQQRMWLILFNSILGFKYGFRFSISRVKEFLMMLKSNVDIK